MRVLFGFCLFLSMMQLMAVGAEPLKIDLIIIAGVLVAMMNFDNLWVLVISAVSANRGPDSGEHFAQGSRPWLDLCFAAPRAIESAAFVGNSCEDFNSAYGTRHNSFQGFHLKAQVTSPCAEIVFSYFAWTKLKLFCTMRAIYRDSHSRVRSVNRRVPMASGTAISAKPALGSAPPSKFLMAPFANYLCPSSTICPWFSTSVKPKVCILLSALKGAKTLSWMAFGERNGTTCAR